MLTTPEQAKKLVKDQLFPAWEQEQECLERIDCWSRWKHEPIKVPAKATLELKLLAELSRVPWLTLVVTVCVQAMYVDGYRSRLDPEDTSTDGSVSAPWQAWLANGMDRHQIAIHRAALNYGYTFETVLPGVDPMSNAPMAVMRGVSPRKMYAAWDDPAADDWPRYALQIVDCEGDKYTVRLLDDVAVHTLTIEQTGTKIEYVGFKLHGADVCPVIRFANQLDLEGRATGEVEPFIPLAARINKTSYDRMLTQHFNSWKVRYITGMAPPELDENANRAALKLAQSDLLITELADSKIGTLDETSLEGFISAHRHDVETLAAVSQTPTHELTGQMANLSAEALAAARASLNQKVTERQKSIGASHAQAMRLAAALNGDTAYAADPTGRVTWQDMEIRSISSAVDALGKAATMLMIPPSELWSRIPGVEKSDVEEWKRVAEQGDPVTRLQAELNRQAGATPSMGQATADAEPSFG